MPIPQQAAVDLYFTVYWHARFAQQFKVFIKTFRKWQFIADDIMPPPRQQGQQTITGAQHFRVSKRADRLRAKHAPVKQPVEKKAFLGNGKNDVASVKCDPELRVYAKKLLSQRLTKPLHCESDSSADTILRHFDHSYKYGPMGGLTRLERWERAKRLGLDPPEIVRKAIVSMDTSGRKPYSGSYSAIQFAL
jgi:hypothetical protein